MRIYNTLSRQIDELKVLSPPMVTIYSCGPTVYSHIHIGNLASFIYADTLRRALEASGNNVKHVINLTDIDDKTIKSSHQKYPDKEPMAALVELTKLYTEKFMEDMQSIGNDLKAYTFIKATDNIKAMQSLIERLVNEGFAYLADDGIYFSIEAYKKSGKNYGQLSAITAASTSAARIQNDEYDKASAHDFALWKKQKPGEPAWDFVVSGQDLKGRPGWHIECSAMSQITLGQPFDIHTGGVDLIFPHHENEIAQSTAGVSNPIYAQYFVHNEHLLVEGQKMSKSLNNFITLDEVKQKEFDPLAFRLLVLQAHYKSQAHFSWENLNSAQNRLQDLRAMAALRWQPRALSHDDTTFALEDVPSQIAGLLADDLNTPQVLAFLSEVSTQLQTVHIEQDMVGHLTRMLEEVDNLLGLKLMAVGDISQEQKDLIKRREVARAAKDWASSDQLRDQLAKQGLGIRDALHGPIWYPAK